MNRRLISWAIRAGKFLIVAVPLAVALVFTTIETTSQPWFCGSCHYMKPYYQSWKNSSHGEVPCTECHISPGIGSELEKKLEAAGMVAPYFTGGRLTRPWAEVEDASCLRAGCHEKRLLMGREVFSGVLFDHRPHLTELRRGKRLRCTSCHSQIVQGAHIEVTTSTCFLCHFKEAKFNEGPARCTLCHEVPQETITVSGLSFDHADVERFGMECAFCHQGVAQGEGGVSQERCYGCHQEPARLARYEETEFLHRTHVAERKVECVDCHQVIAHQVPERLELVAADCRTCHLSGHGLTRDLYIGIGGKGVTPRPSPMYLAGVACEGCHFLPAEERGGLKKANEVSCMACHGAKYFTIYRTWTSAVEERLKGLKELLSSVKERLGDERPEQLAEAEQNIRFLEQADGIHNPDYALELMEKSYQDLVAALGEAGIAERPERPWAEVPYKTECNRCHYGIEYLERDAFGREFPHARHVVDAQLRCTVCHGEMAEHGALKLIGESCEDCHATIAGIPAANDCRSCHQLEEISNKVRFPHREHAEFGFACSVCHQGVEDTPHLEFARSGVALPQMGHEFCGNCHFNDLPPQGKNCTNCHIH